MKHILRATVGPRVGQVLLLSERVTVGRAADCDLQILHEGVSRHHAKISVRDGCVMVTDLSSDNGTYVNKARIERRVLESGDTLQVMDSRFVYELVPDGNPVTSSPAIDDKVTSGDSLRRTGPMDVADNPGVASMPAPGPQEAPSGLSAQATIRYQAGRSGPWRRSAEPQSSPPTVRVAPDKIPPPPAFAASRPLGGRGEADPEADVDAAARRASTLANRKTARDRTARDKNSRPSGARPARESAPVTSGSGSYRRLDAERAKPTAAAASASGSRRSLGNQGVLSGNPAAGRVPDAPSQRIPAAARGGSATVREPDSAGASMARAVRETGEYPPPGALPDSQPEPIANLAGHGNDAHRPGDSAITMLMQRLATDTEFDGDDAEDPDGRLALAAVLQYRAFRQRMLRGPRLSEAEQRQHDQLDRYLQRTVPQDDALAAMRRFTRFSCDLPAELTHADAQGMATLAVAVYDVGAGGAKLDVGTTELKIGDEAWLAIDLSGIPEVPVDGASTVVFKSRVVWMEQAQLGVSFAGAPKYDGGASVL